LKSDATFGGGLAAGILG